MKYKCVKCGLYETGPAKKRKRCPICREVMVPVVVTTEDGEKKERVLKLLEEGEK